MQIGGRLDQDESDPARLVRNVAPKMIGPALDDDAAFAYARFPAVIQFQLDLARHDDAIVDAVGAMHGGLLSGQHVDDPDHRPPVQCQASIAFAAVRLVIIVGRDCFGRPEQEEGCVARWNHPRRGHVLGLEDGAPLRIMARDDALHQGQAGVAQFSHRGFSSLCHAASDGAGGP